MHTFVQQQQSPQQVAIAGFTQLGRALSAPGRESSDTLRFQHIIGNQAAQRMVPTNSDEVKASLSGSALPHCGHDFRQMLIHPPPTGVIQTKLAMTRPDDAYEQEADRLSEQVMRKSEPQLQRTCACGGTCPTCQPAPTGHEHERLQTLRVGSGDHGQTAVPPLVHEVLRSPGQPLDPAARAFMEPRFGHEFSHVRVHTDERAARAAQAINAHAYTFGHDIVFGHGRFDADGTEGRRLLAHELAHVLQQSAGHAGSAVARQPADPSPAEKIEPQAQAPPKPAQCDIGCAQRWGKNTTCSRWGFPLGAHEHAPHFVYRGGKAKKVRDLFIPCCDSWPFSLEKYARDTLGLNGAASCTAAHGREIATVSLLFFKGKKVEGKAVKVLCSDSLSTGGPGAHYGPKPVSPDACSDQTFATDKREVMEMSPQAMEDLVGKGEVHDRLAVSVCYSGAKEDLCAHNGPGKNRNPEHHHCFTAGCTPEEGIPKLEETGWPP